MERPNMDKAFIESLKQTRDSLEVTISFREADIEDYRRRLKELSEYRHLRGESVIELGAGLLEAQERLRAARDRLGELDRVIKFIDAYVGEEV